MLKYMEAPRMTEEELRKVVGMLKEHIRMNESVNEAIDEYIEKDPDGLPHYLLGIVHASLRKNEISDQIAGQLMLNVGFTPEELSEASKMRRRRLH